jgi:nitric oxide reductase NorQ protein
MVVSFNPGYQKSLRELKPSTRQRFVGLSFGYPDADAEAAIVRRESGVDASIAEALVKIARKVRTLKDLSLMETASTRLLVAAGKLVSAGLPPRAAGFTALAEALTDDLDARAALKQLIDNSL